MERVLEPNIRRGFACVLSIAASLLLFSAGLYILNTKQSAQSSMESPPRVGQSSRWQPIPGGGPIFGTKISLDEARSRVPYSIPIPSYVPENASLKEVWVGPTEPSKRDIALVYSNGLTVIITPQWEIPNWDGVVKSGPDVLRLVNVRGTVGEGHESGSHELSHGRIDYYPTALAWWEGGFIIQIYSDYLPLQELIRMAESLPALSRPQQ